MQTLLFLMALLLSSRAGAEEIIGGVESRPHSRPYMAHLEITTERGYKATCGGFLIAHQFVMTAAHCKGRETTVTLGAHDVSKTESTQQKIKVEKQIVHPNYNFYSNLHDIMLLKVPLFFFSYLLLPTLTLPLAQVFDFSIVQIITSEHSREFHVIAAPVGKDQPSFSGLTSLLSLTQQLQKKAKMTPAVDVIPLPQPSDFLKPGKMCRATGWGQTGVTEPTSDTLREVKQRIMDKEACKNYFHYDYNFQVCVGSPRKKRSAYKGDSGGPLVCAGVAHGIVSYGRWDAKPPAVFTRISPYVPWINKVIKGKDLNSLSLHESESPS